ncbi:hypothetical protein Trydic_g14716 [Trypoxylus dichotomus]
MILLPFVSLSYAWTAISLNPPNYTGKGCYSEDLGEMAYGEELQPPNECMLASCQPEGINYIGCSVASVADQNCKIVPGNLSKPYPDCCYEIKCRDEL